MRRTRQRGFTLILGILIAIAALVVGLVTWRVYDAYSKPKSNQPDQTDPNAGYVVIKEWGVRFKPADGLAGAEYFKPKKVTSDAFSITTSELASKEPRCGSGSDMIPIGLLTRSKNPQAENGAVLTVIDGYSYQYRASDAACSENDADFGLESAVGRSVGVSVKTLQAAK